MMSAPAPIAAARSTSPRRCRDRVAAVRRIQNTIPVTRATARTLSSPLTASWAWLGSALAENVSTAAKLPASITAPSTPSHTGAEEARRPAVSADLRRAASRMLTTSPASRPSRNPISRFGTASAHLTRTKVRLT
jgi:hypothetical protein